MRPRYAPGSTTLPLVAVLLALGALAIPDARAQTTLSGTIAANRTLTAAGNPHTVTGTVTVNAGVTLTVQAGVEIRFETATSLNVAGTLNATGATFTSAQATKAAGDWGSIHSYQASSNVSLVNCTVEYGGRSGQPAVSHGAGTLTLDGTTVSRSAGSAVYVQGAAVATLNNVTLSQNATALRLDNPQALTLTGTNAFTGNTLNRADLVVNSPAFNVTLPALPIPYHAASALTVAATRTLTIAAPNVLKFAQGAGLDVSGRLVAVGTAANPITFTDYRDDNAGGDSNGDGTGSAPAVSSWAGIEFYPGSNAVSELRFARVRYAGAGSTGGVTVRGTAAPAITDNDFALNYYGARFDDAAAPTFARNTIGSSTLVPIAMGWAANPTFADNTFSFSDNQYDAIGLLGGTIPANAVVKPRAVLRPDGGTLSNVTYLLLSDVTVPAGRTLTIRPGVVLKGYRAYNIHVNGKLVADGKPDSLITFTSRHDDNVGQPGDTDRNGTAQAPDRGDAGGIVFRVGSDPASVLDHVTLRYANASHHLGYYYPKLYSHGGYSVSGAVITIRSRPRITASRFENVEIGVVALQDSRPEVWGCTFVNTLRTPLAISVSSEPDFADAAYPDHVFTNVGLDALGLVGEAVAFNGALPQRTVAGRVNIPYVLLNDLLVTAGTQVTVAPGVIVKHLYTGYTYQNTGWYVDGGFRAVGTAVAPVIFTSIHDDNAGGDTNGNGNNTQPAPGNWTTIAFRGTSDDAFSRLEHAEVRFGGSYDTGWQAAVGFEDAGGVLSNVRISQSDRRGVTLLGASAPTFTALEISGNRSGSPIGMSLASDPTFTGVTFVATETFGIDLIDGQIAFNARLRKRSVQGIPNVAYIVSSTLTVAAGSVFTIDPGVVLKFGGGITVNGALVAVGTAAEPIIFTSLKDDSAGGDTNNDGNASQPNKGNWYAVKFEPTSNDALNRIEHAAFRYGGYCSSNYDWDYVYCYDIGVVQIEDAAVAVNHVTIEQSRTTAFGIFGTANPTIQNVLVANIDGPPVAMSMFSNPTFGAGIQALNVGEMALGIVPETWSTTATVPIRSFAGFNNITYHLLASKVGAGATITIPAGVVFKGDALTVDGALVVDGTEANPVVFTDVRDDAYGNPADTEGNGAATVPGRNGYRIIFNDVSNDAASVVRHAIFRYASYGIGLNQAAPDVQHTRFEKLYHGLELNGVSTPAVTHSTFHDLTDTPLHLSLLSYPRADTANTISGTTFRGIAVRENETLTQDVTLPKRRFGGIGNIPYIFGPYTIGTSATLTLAPGVVLKFRQDATLTVRKGLIAEGGAHPDSIIVFTDLEDDFYGGDTNADSTATAPNRADTYYYETDWNGIVFENEALDPFSRLRNCVVRWADVAGVTANSASPSVTRCAIRDNQDGIRVTGASDPLLTGNDFVGNRGAAIVNTGSFAVNARESWWGSNTGPTHASNPGGVGGRVTGAVTFSPWGTQGAENALAGDVSLNGIIQPYDAALILQHAANAITLGAVQLRVADVTGNGATTAMDASLVLQFTAGLRQNFPIEVNRKTGDDGPSPDSLVALLHASETGGLALGTFEDDGDRLRVPVRLGATAAFGAAEFELAYDARVFSADSVTTGPAAPGAALAFHADAEAGTLRVALARGATDAAEGDLATLHLTRLRPGAVPALAWRAALVNDRDVLSTATAAEPDAAVLPERVALRALSPNPSRGAVTVGVDVPAAGPARLALYDALGRRVAVLHDGPLAAGTHRFTWDGEAASGLYLFRLEADGAARTRAVTLVR